jgi:hypothetical protein
VTGNDDSPQARLLRALAGAGAPEAFRIAFTSPPPDPAPGQLWRARRGDTTVLILLVGIDASTAHVVPVTLDPDYSDPDAVVLPASASPLASALTVWLRLARELSVRVLDRYVGDLSLPGAAADPGAAVIAAGTPGRQLFSAADPVVEYRARVVDEAAELAATPTLIGSGELAAILKTSDVAVADLVELLGVPLPRVLALRRGKAPLTFEQAQTLAPVLGLDADDLLAANPSPPSPLLARLARPQRRAQVVQLAATRDIAEDTAYETAAFAVFALAARTEGDTGGDAEWDARLDRYFESVLP